MFTKVLTWAQRQADKIEKSINVTPLDQKRERVVAAERAEYERKMAGVQAPQRGENIDPFEEECPGTELERGIAWSYAADAADQAATKIGTVIDHIVREAGDTADEVAAEMNARLETLGENAIRVVPVEGAVEAVREAEDHAEEAWTAAGRIWRRVRRDAAEKIAAVARAVHPGADDVRFFERDDQGRFQ